MVCSRGPLIHFLVNLCWSPFSFQKFCDWTTASIQSIFPKKSFLYEAEEFVSYYALKSSLLALLETLLAHRTATQYLNYPPIPTVVSFFPFMSSPKDDDDDELFPVNHWYLNSPSSLLLSRVIFYWHQSHLWQGMSISVDWTTNSPTIIDKRGNHRNSKFFLFEWLNCSTKKFDTPTQGLQ